MQINVRLIGAFRIDRFKEKISEYPLGIRVQDVVNRLQIPDRSVGTVLINGIHAPKDAALIDGDTLSLLPILGGG